MHDKPEYLEYHYPHGTIEELSSIVAVAVMVLAAAAAVASSLCRIE